MVPKPAGLAALLLAVLAACGGEASSAPGASAEEAPDSFDIAFHTTGGEIAVRFYRAWSPLAVGRVWTLVDEGFWEGARFYRVNDQYAQFGFSGRPELDTVWFERRLPDEPVQASNVEGAVAFGRAGPTSRNFVLFMNLTDNTFLDSWAGDGVAGFPPVGRVLRGLDVARAFNDRYGDAIVPMEDSILASGNAFLERAYPGLDAIERVEILESW